MGAKVLRQILFLIVIGAPVTAILSAAFAYRRRKLFISDFGTIILPSLVFYGVGALRPELHTGWALIVWPVLTFLATAYLFGLRILLIDRFTDKPKTNSVVLLCICLLISGLVAATIPPLYE